MSGFFDESIPTNDFDRSKFSVRNGLIKLYEDKQIKAWAVNKIRELITLYGEYEPTANFLMKEFEITEDEL